MGKIIKKYIRKLVFLFTYYFYIKPNKNSVSSIKLNGFKFNIPPTVFNPRYSVSSKVFADFILSLGSLEGKKILDIGCGSGIASIFAASKGALCAACDINPMAVKSTADNALANGFSDKIKTFESDLFKNSLISGDKFDIIFFNPPYYKGVPKNNFEIAYKGGENLEVIYRFFEECRNCINKDGCIYMIVSSDMGIDELEKIIKSSGYSHNIVTNIKKTFETFYIVRVVI